MIQGHENVGVVEAIGDGGAYACDGTLLRSATACAGAQPRLRHCGPCQRGFPYSSARTSTATATR